MHVVVFLLASVALQAPTEVFDKAVAALASGDYSTAEAGFLQVLRVVPGHVDSLQNLGVVYSRTGRAGQAVAAYRRALELSPGNKSVLLNLGLVYMRQASYVEALPVFQTLVELDDASPPARDIHLLFPLCEGYLRQHQSEETRRTLAIFVAKLPPAMASLVQCKLYFVNERMSEAGQMCRNALTLDPKLPGVHLELARVAASLREPDAGTELDAAISENPGDPESLYDLGVTLLEAGRGEEACSYLDRARRLNPDFWGSYFQLGRARLQLDQPEQAVPLLRKAAELNATSFSLFYLLGRALSATGKTEEAAHALQKVRELMALELDNDAKAMRKK
jgi:tetratricopeptide (TPR) repeat protein